MFDFSTPSVDFKGDNSGTQLFLELGKEMTVQRLDLLKALLSWAQTWDSIHAEDAHTRMTTETDGKRIINNTTFGAMIAPFAGFGLPAQWQIDSPSLSPLIVHEMLQWMGVEDYRKQQSMSWCVLKVAAPFLAMRSSGPAAGAKVSSLVFKFTQDLRNKNG